MKYDIVIVGGGISGSIAGISAARLGSRVLLIEQYGFLGGMLTAAGVGPMMTFHAGHTQVIQGVTGELIERLKSKGLSPGHIFDTTGYTYSVTPFDLEGMKRELEIMLTEAGGHILYHTMLAKAQVDQSRILNITVCNKKGLTAIEGRYFVDATGDADLAWMTGVPCDKGRESDGLQQPVTMKVRLYNVNMELVRQFIKDHPEEFPTLKGKIDLIDKAKILSIGGFDQTFNKAKERGDIHIDRENVLFFETNNPGEIILNTSRITGIDATDPIELSKAEIEGRRQAEELFKFMKKDIPGFQNAKLAFTGPSIGIRSSRQIKGYYTLTQDDIMSGKKFKDAVVCNGYPIDIHNPSGVGTNSKFLPWGEYYTIPYRSLINATISNLITVGRSISGEFEAQAAFRTTPGCGAIGHAGGVASSIADKTNIDFPNLNTEEIRKILIDQGAYLGD